MLMNDYIMIAFTSLLKSKIVNFSSCSRCISLSVVSSNNPRSGLVKNENVESSLWFTTLPTKRKNSLLMKQKKKIILPKNIPKGPPVITCKHEKLNHYGGQRYDNLEAIPLASKGWYHRKSKGDYFTIHPIADHPAFIMTKSDLVQVAGTFEEAGVDLWLQDVLTSQGKHKPTTIQGKAIPSILSGKNVLITAETGCGKTLAYLLPMVQRIARWKQKAVDDTGGRPANSPLGVVIVPNRELALQVGAVLKELCEGTDIVCQTILGGHTRQLLLQPTMEKVDIVVASLGVFSKLTTHRQYLTRDCKHLVLDEADTLLDDSFSEKLVYFIRRFPVHYAGPEVQDELPSGTQLTLVSATMPTSLDATVGKIVSMESLEKISTKYLHRVIPHIPQHFIRVGKNEKADELLRLARKSISEKRPTMIFSNKSEACDWVSLFLNENGVPCDRVHSKMSADERLGKFECFKRGELDVISCTDLTSRGIDCTRVKHVINFDFPLYMADYIHRCGRTGRIGHDEGCQVTNMVSSRREIDLLHQIEIAARTFQPLHNVNNNITRIIHYKTSKNEQVTNPKEDNTSSRSTGNVTAERNEGNGSEK